MIKGGASGGSTITGSSFEKDIEKQLLSIEGFIYKERRDVKGCFDFFCEDELIFTLTKKRKMHLLIYELFGIDINKILISKLEPDNFIVNYKTKTIFIIEEKFQETSGSVDEKLQTCAFKKRQYKKLFADTGFTVEYVYVLSDWFKSKKYSDVVDYIKDSECHCFFDKMPLEFLGIKVVDEVS